jgi:cytochrome c
VSFNSRHVVLLSLLALCACGGPATEPTEGGAAPGANRAPAPPVTADGFDVGEIKSEQEYLAEPRFAEADLRRGEVFSLACRVCHTLGAGQEHRDGPNLHGMFGRRAGTRDGFAYSDALRNAEIIWTPRALDAWLAQPSTFIPGNTMVFAGLRSETDRRDLLAYLLRETAPEGD